MFGASRKASIVDSDTGDAKRHRRLFPLEKASAHDKSSRHPMREQRRERLTNHFESNYLVVMPLLY